MASMWEFSKRQKKKLQNNIDIILFSDVSCVNEFIYTIPQGN